MTRESGSVARAHAGGFAEAGDLCTAGGHGKSTTWYTAPTSTLPRRKSSEKPPQSEKRKDSEREKKGQRKSKKKLHYNIFIFILCIHYYTLYTVTTLLSLCFAIFTCSFIYYFTRPTLRLILGGAVVSCQDCSLHTPLLLASHAHAHT